MKIVEKRPNGRGSTKEVLKWVAALDENASDASGLYKVMVPFIKQAFRYTFSDANPNKWPETSQKWRDRKAKLGYPTTIGYMTGALSRSFSETPDIKITKERLKYTFDKSEAGYKGRSVMDYIWFFIRERKIMPYTREWVRRNMKNRVIQHWLKMNKTVEK